VTPTQPGTPTVRSRFRAVVVSTRSAEGRESFLIAAAALGVLLVVRFALGLLALVGSAIGFSATAFPSGFAATPVGQFLGGFVLYPFPFYLAAFAVLVLVRPIRARDGLDVVLRSTLVAGLAGTAALILVGVAPGVALSREGGTWVNLALYLTTIPLSAGVVDTAVLVLGGVLARSWLHGGDPASPSRDGESDALATDHETDVDVDRSAAARGEPSLPVDGSAPGRVVPAAPTAPPSSDDWTRYAPPPARDESGR